ncbi:MAG TPA: hypothetical protein VIF62_10505, partial [Labilithrix sp.]
MLGRPLRWSAAKRRERCPLPACVRLPRAAVVQHVPTTRLVQDVVARGTGTSRCSKIDFDT